MKEEAIFYIIYNVAYRMHNRQKRKDGMYSALFYTFSERYSTHEEPVSAPYIRKRFFLNETKVYLNLCGLGFYRLFINGKEITRSKYASYIYNPDDLLYYDRYELENYVQRGENVLGLILGNGFLNNIGGQVWALDKAKFRSSPKFACSMESSSGEVLFEADESFCWHESPIVYDDWREGEHYDAREEIPDWKEINFDDSAWKSVIRAETPKGIPTESKAPPVLKKAEYKPRSVKKVGNGYVYEFPYNVAGVCRLNVKGKSGQKIKLRYFESVDDAGNPFYANLGFENVTREDGAQTDIYICNGLRSEYEPSFTYHGFQYVYVEGISSAQATLHLLTCCVYYSDVRENGNFVCSDVYLNLLQDMVRRSDKNNLVHIPTDCPQREKNGWTADAALSAHQMFLNFDMKELFAEWLKSVRAAQRKDGALPGIVPTDGWGFDWGNGPAWDCVIADLPYEIYRFTGDKKVIEDNAQSMISYVNYLKSKVKENGLLEFGLGDWCQADIEANDGFEASLELTDSVVSVRICEEISFLLRAIGKEGQAQDILKFSSQLRAKIKEKWIDEKTSVCKDLSQTAQTICLYYGYFQDEQAAALELVNRVKRKGCIGTGVIGGQWLFHTLSRYGYQDLAYQLIMRKAPPSYRYIVERGSTTLWEKFYDFGEHKGNAYCASGRRVESLNHHFWGNISSWFYETIAGIWVNPHMEDPDYVEIAPQPPKTIQEASAEYRTLHGGVRVSWFRQDGKIKLDVSVWGKTRAKVLYDGEMIEQKEYILEIEDGSKQIFMGDSHGGGSDRRCLQ